MTQFNDAKNKQDDALAELRTIRQEQAARIARLVNALESIEALCDEDMGEWASVEYGYLPVRLANTYHIREGAREAIQNAKG